MTTTTTTESKSGMLDGMGAIFQKAGDGINKSLKIVTQPFEKKEEEPVPNGGTEDAADEPGPMVAKDGLDLAMETAKTAVEQWWATVEALLRQWQLEVMKHLEPLMKGANTALMDLKVKLEPQLAVAMANIQVATECVREKAYGPALAAVIAASKAVQEHSLALTQAVEPKFKEGLATTQEWWATQQPQVQVAIANAQAALAQWQKELETLAKMSMVKAIENSQQIKLTYDTKVVPFVVETSAKVKENYDTKIVPAAIETSTKVKEYYDTTIVPYVKETYETKVVPFAVESYAKTKEMFAALFERLREMWLKVYGPMMVALEPVVVKLEPYKLKATEYIAELKAKADPYFETARAKVYEPALATLIGGSKMAQEKAMVAYKWSSEQSVVAYNATKEWWHSDAFPLIQTTYQNQIVPVAAAAMAKIQEQTAVWMKQLEPLMAQIKQSWQETLLKFCGPVMGAIKAKTGTNDAPRAAPPDSFSEAPSPAAPVAKETEVVNAD